jgi:spoIIIJ-associated protein
LLIGKRGQTLDAIQFLANAVLLSQLDKPILADLDAQGYRERRARQLQKVADRGLAELMKNGGTVELEAMTSSERKAIHNYLKDNADVETFSVGNEPNRRLTLSLRD